MHRTRTLVALAIACCSSARVAHAQEWWATAYQESLLSALPDPVVRQRTRTMMECDNWAWDRAAHLSKTGIVDDTTFNRLSDQCRAERGVSG